MEKMKTLTVNGQTYTVWDPEAVSFEQPQQLTPRQQAQARSNLDVWSASELVRRLCPAFMDRGAAVVCAPVEGDLLEVTAEDEASQITRCGKNLIPKTEPRTETRNGTTFALNEDGSVSISGTPADNSSIYLTTELSVEHLRGKQVTVNHNVGENVYLAINLFYNDGTDTSWNWLRGNRADSLTKVVPSNARKMEAFVVALSDFNGDPMTFYPQLEFGSAATAYEPYKEAETFMPGEPIPALSGTNAIFADTGLVTVTGRADPVAIIEKLTNAIVALGGNV